MASSSSSSTFESFYISEKPHFFKVITEENLSFDKLRLPPAFVLKHGREVSRSPSLRVPNGVVWPVRLSKPEGNNVWIKAGWYEFAKFYGLGDGFMVAFELDEVDRFRVCIFDTSTREIKYQCDTSDEQEHITDDESYELPTTTIPRYESTSHNPCPSRKTAAFSASKTKSKLTSIPLSIKKESVPLTESGIKTRSASNAKNNGTSITHVKPNGSKNGVGISENGSASRAKPKVMACVSKPKPSKTANDLPSKNIKRDSTAMNNGTSTALAKTNGKAGLKIRRFKTVAVKNPSKKGKASKTADRSFKVKMREHYLGRSRGLFIPTRFAKKYLKRSRSNVTPAQKKKKQESNVTLFLSDTDEKTWDAEYHYVGKKAHNALLYGGWYDFVCDNKLSIDDVCEFQLTNAEKLKLKVSITRFSDNHRQGLLRDK